MLRKLFSVIAAMDAHENVEVRIFNPFNSYRVTLDDDHDLRWTTVKNGEIVTFDHEPETSLWKRFSADMIKLLPIEGQL